MKKFLALAIVILASANPLSAFANECDTCPWVDPETGDIITYYEGKDGLIYIFVDEGIGLPEHVE